MSPPFRATRGAFFLGENHSHIYPVPNTVCMRAKFGRSPMVVSTKRDRQTHTDKGMLQLSIVHCIIIQYN